MLVDDGGKRVSEIREPPRRDVARLDIAEKLVDAATKLNRQSGAMQLRYLQTLTEIAGEKSSTIVFPFPVDIMQGLKALLPEQRKPPE